MSAIPSTRFDAESGPDQPPRVVVNLVGDAVHGRLAESRWVDRPYLPGGEHNCYEFAFAAAECGYDVELRGWLDRPAFERLASAARARPRIDLPARPPDANDLVVVPEGWRDPLEYARLVLSPARLALFILAAPGLFGWPFAGPGWKVPDPLNVELDAVARPEHFAAMSGLGFQLLTHSPGLVQAARAAGVDCAFVGTGRPFLSGGDPVAKEVDVASVLDNRWAPLVERVLCDLDGAEIDRIGEVRNDEILTRFARARVLVWPSRIEGHATIPWEARMMGCVPVALDSNRFAVGLDEAHGAVLVESVEKIGPAVQRLLADPARWKTLSERGRRTAPQEVDWERYVARVRAFLDALPVRSVARDAAAGMGDALSSWLDERAADTQARLDEKEAQIAIASADLTSATERQASLTYELEHLRADHKALDNKRHEQAEYILYLEQEHHRLAAEIHKLHETIEAAPYRRAQRMLVRVKRELLK